MSKKILSVFVALMMVVSLFAMTANAAYYYESEEDIAAETYTQEWALSEPVDNNDGTWSVDVLLTTDYATGPIQFVVTNTDTSVAAIKTVTLGDAITFTKKAPSYSKSTGKVMIVPDSSSTGTIAVGAIDGVIATIVYTYSGSGSATIAIDNNPKSETNPGGTLIAARMSNENAVTGDAIAGQVVLGTGEERIIGASSVPPTLAVIDGMEGVIDTDRTELNIDGDTVTGYIYGIEPENGETVADVFEVVGDGYMEIEATEAGSEEATGTIVNVFDNDGNLVENYVVVIFGDIDGDGQITVYDCGDAQLHDAWGYGENLRIESPVLLFAGDLDMDGDITVFDADIMALHDAWGYGDNLRLYQSEIIASL